MITGRIFDIKRFTIHDGPGIRTTVFLQGCPLKCLWCHNPESQDQDQPGCGRFNFSYEQDEATGFVGWQTSVNEIMTEIEKDILFYDQSGGGITVSGGEPLSQIEFLDELLSTCKQKDIHTAVDTCGYAPWDDFVTIMNRVDLFLYDLKFIDDSLHQHYTGVSNQSILDNLKNLAGTGSNTIVRIPVIPAITDSRDNIRQLAEFVHQQPAIKQVSLLPYNFMAEEKYKKLNRAYPLTGLRPLPDQSMNEIKRIFENYNLEVTIGD